ncbi:uncharacterized protein LOC105158524 [Sesamum indicum]|uniref:Uncharacterized protein LOC105158524 n=1 Tax=Sesamum indicum TaxID=4182 RepID=A0A6I9SVW9_SESIN|nr:uncharacterized protein LOC105158524 [Sesamum indicum]
MDSRNYYGSSSSPGRACLCSPTSHPGSFRCSLHRSPTQKEPAAEKNRVLELEASSTSSRMSKMGIVKAFVMKLIKPSTNDNLPRRRNFQPKPTRFFDPNS